MSQKQNLADLRQQLERWKSHNEVHAKPADGVLYEFLSGLLKLGEDDEQDESNPAQANESEISVAVEAETNASTVPQADGEEGGGGNHPPHQPGKP
jgi:hypothetical protein